MSALSINVPFPVFTDRDGNPLEAGYVWIGEPYLSPQSNPVAVYFDDALTIPAPQPLRTLNGYVSRMGSPAQIYIDGANFSILVQDKKGTPVYSFDDGTGISPDAAGVTYNPGADSLMLPIAPLTVAGAFDALSSDGGQGASFVGYLPAGTGAVATTVQTKLRESVSVKDFGAVGEGGTDDTSALMLARAAMLNGAHVHFPAGTYLTSAGLIFPAPVSMSCDPGTRIKLTAYSPAVLTFDYTGGGAFFDHGGYVDGFVLDGGVGTGCFDGLLLKGVISAHFKNVRATNVTRAGLHCAWAQLCNFENFSCSANIEAFLITPTNGVLADTATSSANTFTNVCIEKVSGCGIQAEAFINTVFVNGTSEGNGTTGIEFGVAAGTATALGNTVIGMDLEVNPVADIIVHPGAGSNTFVGVAAGYSSGPVKLMPGSKNSTFIGGVTGGFIIEAGATNASIKNTALIGVSAPLTDNGTRTMLEGVYNLSTGAQHPNSTTPNSLQVTASVAASAGYIIDCKISDYFVLEAGGSITVANPANPVNGQALDITIWNTTGGAITVVWDTAFRVAGWVNPASGTNRSVRLRYNATFGRWYVIGMSTADAPN